MIKGKRPAAPLHEDPDLLSGNSVINLFNNCVKQLDPAKRSPRRGFVNVNKTVNKTFTYIGNVNNNVNKTYPGNVNKTVNKKGLFKGGFVNINVNVNLCNVGGVSCE